MLTIELKLAILRSLKKQPRWVSELREQFANVKYSVLREAISELVVERVVIYRNDRNLLALRRNSVGREYTREEIQEAVDCA